MGIFSGLFRSRDKPQNRTTGSAYSFFFGSSSAGKRVNEMCIRDSPWFPELPDADAVKAYTHFISALCEMSKNAKRVTVTEKTVENEKYAFRCFLLRLGFIGAEYKTERKILLKNLTGSSAFKSGAKKEVSGDEISK